MSFILLGILNSQVSAAAGGSYELIESNILTSSASSVTFSSIPQDYKHLQIRATARNDNASTLTQLWVRANADSGSNYSSHYIYGNGSTVASSALTTDTAMKLQFSAAANNNTGTFAGLVLDFLDYASTSKNTTMRGLSGHAGGTGNFVVLSSGLWQNTAAVTSLTLVTASGSLIAGSRFSLYGIRG